MGENSERRDEPSADRGVSPDQPVTEVFAEGMTATEGGGGGRVKQAYTQAVSPDCSPSFKKRWLMHLSVFIAEPKTSTFSKYTRSAQRLKEANKLSTLTETQDPLQNSCVCLSGLTTPPPILRAPVFTELSPLSHCTNRRWE